MRVRLDTEREAAYYRHGGIIPCVLCRMLAAAERQTGEPPTT
jgi:aconitase A